MRVRVVAHDPEWRGDYENEAICLGHMLTGVILRIHHIGSTAIPGIAAKPVIDILLEVVNLATLDKATPAFEMLGYETMGEYGIPGRRYFRRDNDAGRRTHQVHAFQVGSGEIERHLAFRDYMIKHPRAAQEYGNLKLRLARDHSDDIEAYMDGKDAFVKKYEAMALVWRSS